MKIFDGGYCVPFLVEEDAYENVCGTFWKTSPDGFTCR